MEHIYLIGLDSKSYEHPLDRKILNILKGKTGFEAATNAFLNWSYIKWNVVALKGGCFQITQESCADLYNQFADIAKTLDIHPLPSLYSEWEYGINGYTTGFGDDTLMVLKTGAIDLLTEEELRFVVGHEFGHIKSGHVIYHLMAQFFNDALSSLPLIGNLTDAIKYLLFYWSRLSEFTADRAGLLACQNIDVAIQATMKMSGLPIKYYNKSIIDGFLKQAESFELDLDSLSDKAIKAISIATSSHPWTVLRASELLKWYKSGEYESILNGCAHDVCIWPDCAKPIMKGSDMCPHCGRPQNV